MRTTKRTYEAAVKELVDGIYEATALEELADFIENGLMGIREMPNAQLRAEWRCRFDETLTLTDPQANPNGEGDPKDYVTG
jgi:hypothetical protein